MNQEFNLSKLQKAGYRFGHVTAFTRNSTSPFCIICDTHSNINVTAFWVNEEEKRVFVYYLCDYCGEELRHFQEGDQKAIVANVIEKKIMALPRFNKNRILGGNNVKRN